MSVGDAPASALLSSELTAAGGIPSAAASQTSSALLSPNLMQAAGNQFAGMPLPGVEQSGALMTPSISGGATGIKSAAAAPSMMDKAVSFAKENPLKTGLMGAGALGAVMQQDQPALSKPISTIRPYEFQRTTTPGAFDDVTDSRERRYFEDRYVAKEPYQLARGGLAAFAAGGRAKKPNPLEQRYEMADLRDSQAMQKKAMGMYQYAVGGKAVSGPGDGMSDDVKANINGVREARLSDGEFVIPADVVSGLGNGSTDAGSKQLRAMMDRVRQKRTGRKQQAPQIKVKGLMPA
jgi:hypothetical protein